MAPLPQAEAELAACLFFELRSFLIKLTQQDAAKLPRPVSVGVITPYREQRKLLRDTFVRVCGKQAAAEVLRLRARALQPVEANYKTLLLAKKKGTSSFCHEGCCLKCTPWFSFAFLCCRRLGVGDCFLSNCSSSRAGVHRGGAPLAGQAA
jgi:hypothetical protein